ncbi:RidA family protein [Paraburkholderia sp. Ac-20336]|uniref:RidA family protein n=1 Tax=Burkholderiaceae TaxID=119060 RepID=UPI00142211D2|nr:MULTISPECIES: RidA family protein [Burkholderiaceae]MBN3801891.1 RidA family protein [Paraburkholderia sp. Ac-20336]MBN3846242.1 RidA family protein [Paraburkholderia sp. Ac-20342]NIF55471.1 RidA family protein [Burkholderia sp. Ax-1724]NIF80534.1 RidA family protein [Paraburkholderia sp. Cy-641]
MAELQVQKLKSGSVYEDKNSYSRAVVVDNWVLVANTAGRHYRTREISKDPAEQTLQCFANIEGALKAVGASLADVVRSRIAIPNLDHKEAVMAVVSEKFKDIDPAATITATPLAGTEYLVEIEVTAYRGAGAARTEKMRVSL